MLLDVRDCNETMTEEEQQYSGDIGKVQKEYTESKSELRSPETAEEDHTEVNSEVDSDSKEEAEAQAKEEQEPVNENNEEPLESIENEESVEKTENDGDEPNEDPNNEDNPDSEDKIFSKYNSDVMVAMDVSMLNDNDNKESQTTEETEENGIKAPEGEVLEDVVESEKEKQPFMRFCNETELDSNDDKSDEEADLDDGEETEEAGLEQEEEDELTLEGEPEIGDMEDVNPLDGDDPGEYDPLYEEGIGVDEDTNGFLDQINSGSITEIQGYSDQPSSSRQKRKRSNSSDDGNDEDFNPVEETTSQKKSGPGKAAEVYFKCNLCLFPFDTLGEMKVHRYTDHEQQERPSYLDLAEAALVRLNRKKGAGGLTVLTVSAGWAQAAPAQSQQLGSNQYLYAGGDGGPARDRSPGDCQEATA